MTSAIVPAGALPQKAHVFGEPRLHTDGELLALAFDSDNSLWTVEEPGLLRRWNTITGRQLEWTALSDLETLWAFSSDARFLASASDDITLWDVASGQVRCAFRQEGWVTALTFAPDPALLATGHDDGAIRCWHAGEQQLVHEFRLHATAVSALAFSPDGRLLAAAGEDKVISLWDLVTGLHVGSLEGHTDRIPALAFHPDGEHLVSAGWDTTARVWSMSTLEPVILLNSHNAQATALAFNDDGSLLASADAGLTVHIWDFKTRKTLVQLRGPQGEIRSLAFTRDGKRLACNGERMIHIWDPRTGKAQGGAGPRPAAPTSLAVSPDGQLLASNGGGSNPCIWDVASRQPKVELLDKEILHNLAFSPDGRMLAGAAEDHIRLWDATSGKLYRDLEEDFDEAVTQLAFSPDGKYLATASCTGLDVWIWSVADGKPVFIIDDGLDGCVVKSLAFHPAGRLLAIGGVDWLATGGSNGAISIWDIAERTQLGDFFLDGTSCVAFHPGGQLLASASLDRSICIWNMDTKEIEAELMGHENAVSCVGFSQDGRWLASGGEDRTVRLWDAAWTERAAMEVDSQITSLAFSPDGQHLVAAHANTTCSQIRLSDLLSPEPASRRSM